MKNKGTLILIIFLVAVYAGLFVCIKGGKKDNYDVKEESQEKKEVEVIKDNSAREINPSTFIEIENYINSEDRHMIILGKSGCYYCQLYVPIVREVSIEQGFEFMYIDLKSLSYDDYTALFTSEIKIPQKCSGSDQDKYLKEGFGTPTTLFYENGKTFDCIRGYVNKETLINTISDNGFKS